MPRYIEAVKSAEIISEKLNIPLGDLVDVFAEIPTADVVEVVRCKECIHRVEGCKMCMHPKAIGWDAIEPEDDDFCSYGERKEGD